jgi:tetratricopeptide (TPR) repeat protein
MKNLVIVVILVLAGVSLQAQPALQAPILEQANQAYSSGQYAEAAEKYESVIGSGYESAVLYYNLGNAYFKLNSIPAAILNYEKGRKLNPSDEDILFNLNLANSRIIDKMEPLPEFFLKSWWKTVRDSFSSNQWARTGVFLFIISLIAAALFLISASVLFRKISFWSGIIVLTATVLSFLFSISSYREFSTKSSAIIFTPTVTVKSSPNDNSVDLFVIHEGTKVQITDTVEGWSEVHLANGNVGWVKADTYRPI